VDPADEHRRRDERLNDDHDTRQQSRPLGCPPEVFETRAFVLDGSWGEIRNGGPPGSRTILRRVPPATRETHRRDLLD
jgi:hypothetical protein